MALDSDPHGDADDPVGTEPAGTEPTQTQAVPFNPSTTTRTKTPAPRR